jgi:hypothetical protein
MGRLSVSSATGKTSDGGSWKGSGESVLAGGGRRKGRLLDGAGRGAVRVLLRRCVLGMRRRSQGWEEVKEKERNRK